MRVAIVAPGLFKYSRVKGISDISDLSNCSELNTHRNEAAAKSVLCHVELQSAGDRGD